MKHIKELFPFLSDRQSKPIRFEVEEYIEYLKTQQKDFKELKYRLWRDVAHVKDLINIMVFVAENLETEDIKNLNDDTLLTVEDVAKRLGLSQPSVRNAINSGKLKVVRFDTVHSAGGRKSVRVKPSDLLEFINKDNL